MATREGVTVRVKVIVDVQAPIDHNNPSPVGDTYISRELSRVLRTPGVYGAARALLNEVSHDVYESLPEGLDEF